MVCRLAPDVGFGDAKTPQVVLEVSGVPLGDFPCVPPLTTSGQLEFVIAFIRVRR